MNWNINKSKFFHPNWIFCSIRGNFEIKCYKIFLLITFQSRNKYQWRELLIRIIFMEKTACKTGNNDKWQTFLAGKSNLSNHSKQSSEAGWTSILRYQVLMGYILPNNILHRHHKNCLLLHWSFHRYKAHWQLHQLLRRVDNDLGAKIFLKFLYLEQQFCHKTAHKYMNPLMTFSIIWLI